MRRASWFLALVLTLPAVHAFHAENEPLLASGNAEGPFWVAHRFSTEGGKVAADLWGYGITGDAQVGVLIYDDQDRFVSGSTFTFRMSPGESGAQLTVDLAPGLSARYDGIAPPGQPGYFGFGLIDNDGSAPPRVGTFTWLFWYSGSLSSGTFALRGAPGTTLLGTTSGDDAYLFTSRDFDARASAVLMTDAGAHAVVEGAREISVAHTLVGVFTRASQTSLGEIALTDGARTWECPCSLTAMSGASRAGPGSYTLSLTGAGVGPWNLGEVFFGGADVTLPPRTILEE